jgi:hypothetical protein
VRCNYSFEFFVEFDYFEISRFSFSISYIFFFKVTSRNKATISSPNSTVAPLSTISAISPLWIVPTANESSY